MDGNNQSKSERAAKVSDFVADRIRAERQEREHFAKHNWVEQAEPLDIPELLGLDSTQLDEWREGARKAHAEHVEKVKSRLKTFRTGSVPKRSSLFPLDIRPDNASLPICLSKPDAVEFSPGINGTGDLNAASMELRYESTGVGGHFGLEASPAVLPDFARFWYGFDPPAGGTLVVLGSLSVRGALTAYKYSSSSFVRFMLKNPALTPGMRAEVWVDLVLRVHQEGPFFVQTERVPYASHENPQQWNVTEIRILPGYARTALLSAQIAPDRPVAIELGIEFQAIGRSDFCAAEISLHDPGVVAEALCLNLLPPEVIL